MPIEKDGRPAVAGYGTGVAGVPQVNKAINEAWREVLEDPDEREKAARILGIDAAQLSQVLPAAPFEAKPNESGLGPVEVAILIFVGNVAYDVAKSLAKAAAEAALKALWEKVIKPRVENYLPFQGLGDKKDIADT